MFIDSLVNEILRSRERHVWFDLFSYQAIALRWSSNRGSGVESINIWLL